ncbi:MAG TPA: hypothetical protein VHX61_18500 [Rhizomicrobium sp.]|jgi:hypothetical protein|nr:hypothetical protein [Rhizomicrobium sp.]
MSRRHRSGILDDRKIVATIIRLHMRISERFPGSGLASVCETLADVAKVTAARAALLGRPYWGFRVLACVVVATGLAAQIWFAVLIDWSGIIARARPVELAEGLDAIVNLLILAFGGIWFVMTLEQRWKRRRVLAHLYEFRSLAHIVDMHQLTKDPTVVLSGAPPTASSPERRMSEFELSRYLDYCAEMLALIAKLAALYAERTQDREVTTGVNEIEELTGNLGRKIWQKIMIIRRLDERQATAPASLPA